MITRYASDAIIAQSTAKSPGPRYCTLVLRVHGTVRLNGITSTDPDTIERFIRLAHFLLSKQGVALDRYVCQRSCSSSCVGMACMSCPEQSFPSLLIRRHAMCQCSLPSQRVLRSQASGSTLGIRTLTLKQRLGHFAVETASCLHPNVRIYTDGSRV